MSALAPVATATCPFHAGPATLDLLLAELDPRDRELFDAALDLRSLFAAEADAAACIAQLFHVRALLGDRHYLAFYRVRCWARRAIRVEVRADRRNPWEPRTLPLDVARMGELVNAALATLASLSPSGEIPAAAHLRFAFINPSPALAATS